MIQILEAIAGMIKFILGVVIILFYYAHYSKPMQIHEVSTVVEMREFKEEFCDDIQYLYRKEYMSHLKKFGVEKESLSSMTNFMHSTIGVQHPVKDCKYFVDLLFVKY